MKDFVSVLKEFILFYRETLGHPDPAKRTKLSTVIVMMVCLTGVVFLYNHGAALVNRETPTQTQLKALRDENIGLQVENSRIKRQYKACTVDRDDLLAAYNAVLDGKENLPPTIESPHLSNELYDRLDGLR